MNKKRDIEEWEELFFQAGRDLVEKIREAESVDRGELLSSWKEVEAKVDDRSARHVRLRRVFLAVAASVAVLLAVGAGLWIWEKDEDALSISLLDQEMPDLSDEEVVLVAEGDRMQLKDESSVKYGKDGEPELEEGQVVKKIVKKEKETEKKALAVSQIVVPKGRKADITFSDGTKMYVNSGSRVIYPSLFEKDKREIIVEGEVYLDVKRDPACPFIVKTKGFEVKVLGTQFNLCAYSEDASASVVLVEGKVEVETAGKRKATLSPNQLISIRGEEEEIREVDVFEYICWKDNIMLLNGRTAGEVFERLSRRYGCRIVYDEEIGSIPVSGKLDLREKPEDVVHILCQSLYLTYSVDADKHIIITKKEKPM